MSKKFIEFENVYYSYETSDDEDQEALVVAAHPAVNGITFSVNKGEFVAIAGRNGSGKSTIARLMNALLEVAQPENSSFS